MPRQHVENKKEFWSENEAKRANKHAHKRTIYWPPFWNKVYGKQNIWYCATSIRSYLNTNTNSNFLQYITLMLCLGDNALSDTLTLQRHETWGFIDTYSTPALCLLGISLKFCPDPKSKPCFNTGESNAMP